MEVQAASSERVRRFAWRTSAGSEVAYATAAALQDTDALSAGCRAVGS
jgi:hypothetical protein